jgi:hypothetical protein
MVTAESMTLTNHNHCRARDQLGEAGTGSSNVGLSATGSLLDGPDPTWQRLNARERTTGEPRR